MARRNVQFAAKKDRERERKKEREGERERVIQSFFFPACDRRTEKE